MCSDHSQVHGRRLGLQPRVRPRPGHRVDRRRDRQPGQRARARGGLGAVGARPRDPAGRDRLAVRDQRAGLLHRRRAPEPHPRRVQAGDHAGLQAARPTWPRARRGRPGGGRGRAGGRGAGGRRRAAVAAPARRAAPGGAGRRTPKQASGLFAAVAQPGKVAGVDGAPAAERRRRAATPTCSCRPCGPRSSPAPAAPRRPRRGRSRRAGRRPRRACRGAYPGDDAPKEQLAAWMASEAEKRGLPPQLPVMAALVESNLHERQLRRRRLARLLPDARLIRNNGDYAGFADDPKKQIDWFLDTRRARQGAARRRAANRSTTRASSANGSPTSNAPPSSTAAATSSASTRPTGCSPTRPSPPRPTPQPAAPPAAAAPPPPEAAPRAADRPGPVRPGGHGRHAGRRGAGAAEEQEHRARRRRRRRHQGRADRPADRRRCSPSSARSTRSSSPACAATTRA